MVNPVNFVKSIVSILLLLFSLLLVVSLIFARETSLSQDLHPIAAFVLLWVALFWLGMVEGGQASMVGLPPVNRKLYRHTHPISYEVCELGHHGDNLDRYLMGRQFLVLTLVFVINMAGAPVTDHVSVIGLPEIVNTIFLQSGLAMILITCMLGQLYPQVNASRCMLDFVNTNFMTATLYVALAVEASGILHASYLIQHVVLKMAGIEIESVEGPRTPFQNLMFWGRITFSCLLLLLSFTVTLAALFEGKTTMWPGMPTAVSFFLFFFLMSVVGMLEGMQICFFAVAKITEEERNTSFWASKTCDLLFQGDGRNLPAFMIGRQLGVASCFFIIARITTTKLEDDEGNILADNALGIPIADSLQKFFDTGLLGALITTIVASLGWQLVASAFPVAYMSNPVTYFFLRSCLLLESTGVCNTSWMLANLHANLVGFELDEVYIGTAEERYENEQGDPPNAKSSIGHLSGGGVLFVPVTKAAKAPDDWEYIANVW